MIVAMEGPKQLKRVSWAPSPKLCQVRLFLSEDAPIQSGLGNQEAQDNLQAKAAWLLHSVMPVSDDSVPPGFESPHRSQLTRNIPLVKWQCPPTLWMNPDWLVVAGEESEEVALQDRRQLEVLEAVYPRLSSIPPDPSVTPEVQAVCADDSNASIIPIIAIEDGDVLDYDPSIPSTAPLLNPLVEHSFPIKEPPRQLPSAAPGPASLAEPDVAAAASAAFTAIMRSNEEGSLIDRDLLIKILSDPSMLEKLVSEYGTPKQTPPSPLPMACSSTSGANALPTVSPTRPPVKDASYYKSLIQKHGGEPQESSKQFHLGNMYTEGGGLGHGQRQRESRNPKVSKPCAYFNTPRGCRQGANCSYLHVALASQQMEQMRGAKRVKLDR
ncbi:hypothetical protein HPP92_001874 [Vanilla planifolia]|uniref:C3H1-type domain-containing protein n=1 Tax=Vanilla planifolia TaxID=51239 RepID=A0A835VK30_VANPL|nr:hypothetical protein HPP92_001874 [Vanilla planifolia]